MTRTHQGPILWPLPSQDSFAGAHGHPEFTTPASEVHVWAAPLDVALRPLASLEATLCPEERQRVGRFRFALHRTRFIAGRGLMRSILARYLGLDPGAVEFCYGPNGKPYLPDSLHRCSLHFNLAHSEDLALLAVTSLGPVGIDVERVRVLEDAQELVGRFFSEAESLTFRNLPERLKAAAFFNLWTRKEAWLKATGEGIAHSLRRVEVSFLPGRPARLERLPADLGNPTEWSLHNLVPARGFAAALAVRGDPRGLGCWHWDFASSSATSEDSKMPT